MASFIPSALTIAKLNIGFVDEKSTRIYEKKQRSEGKMAKRHGVAMEKTDVALGEKRSQDAW